MQWRGQGAHGSIAVNPRGSSRSRVRRGAGALLTMDMAIEHAMNKLHATIVISERLPRTRSQHDGDSGLTLSSTEASVASLAAISKLTFLKRKVNWKLSKYVNAVSQVIRMRGSYPHR